MCPSRCGHFKTQANSGYRPPMVQSNSTSCSFQGPAPQTHVVQKQILKDMSQPNDAVFEKHAKPSQNLQSQLANLTVCLQNLLLANTAFYFVLGLFPGPKAVNQDVEVTKDTMPPTNNGSTENVQPPVVQIQTRNPNPEPNVAPVVTPVPKASIPFPSRRNDERRKEKANDQIEKFYEIFRDLSFEISFTDALMQSKICFTDFKNLEWKTRKKLSELARNSFE
ncbi:hypothetical protein Tco_1193581 [Tanacetum coccineum]